MKLVKITYSHSVSLSSIDNKAISQSILTFLGGIHRLVLKVFLLSDLGINT